MRPVFFVIPGDIGLPTGGYGYDRAVLAHAAGAGLDLAHVAIPGGYPYPDAATLAETARIIGALPAEATLLIDGLAYGAMPADLINSFGRPIFALNHHPLALEPGLDAATAQQLEATERAALQLARGVIVTAPRTAETLHALFGVPTTRIAVAEPGTVRAPRAAGTASGVPHLLAVGSIIPRKGYDVMVDALAEISDLPWHLDIAGSLTLSPPTTEALRGRIAQAGLADRITLHGALAQPRLDQLYAAADVFVMSSRYEGYGMVIAEALARGLPIVSTRGGAIEETLPDSAGIKVDVDDRAALAGAIRRLLHDAALRRRMADASWLAGQALPDWHDTAHKIRRHIEALS